MRIAPAGNRRSLVGFLSGGWLEPVPQIQPVAFHIGFWTNVDADAAYPFSRPGELIQEEWCEEFGEVFVGYDRDPGDTSGGITDSTFQYMQVLKEPFIQEPGTIYWLSIAAVFPAGTQANWGWKIRPHYFDDDAVRIFTEAIQVGTVLDPSLAEPIFGPDGASWDLAFELSAVPEPTTMLLIGGGLVGLMFGKRR